ncbi:hypothetical protein BKK81_08190 [Cupriavidus sp. USMAHM13]|uniref:Uncharacterized protein n=1 Tax=Cupriavidus malaysiensis TaxID=367825 RepID=A0ABM6F2M8_9BURK|nr:MULTISPECIES: hypothetical protein [Cupriavidus]AOY99241.1 hypothetical protein BKK81_08190 [Cupriavidus sp. USMAHM13]AOZ05664.1 hypothetical protein BKK80_07495 [Cupriavidus malaysiensis]
MQVFSLFDSPFSEAGQAVGPGLGLHARLLPDDFDGLGGGGADCVLLREGETQQGVAVAGAQLWTCLRGALALSLAGEDGIVLLGAGDLFMPPGGGTLRVCALLDSVLVCTALEGAAPAARERAASWQDGALLRADEAVITLDAATLRAGGDGVPGRHAALAAVRRDEQGWAEALARHGLRWAVCYRGVLRLRWWSLAAGSEDAAPVQEAYLQPGMAYAPDAGERYRLEALSEPAGLLCGLQPPAWRAAA